MGFRPTKKSTQHDLRLAEGSDRPTVKNHYTLMSLTRRSCFTTVKHVIGIPPLAFVFSFPDSDTLLGFAKI